MNTSTSSAPVLIPRSVVEIQLNLTAALVKTQILHLLSERLQARRGESLPLSRTDQQRLAMLSATDGRTLIEFLIDELQFTSLDQLQLNIGLTLK